MDDWVDWTCDLRWTGYRVRIFLHVFSVEFIARNFSNIICKLSYYIGIYNVRNQIMSFFMVKMFSLNTIFLPEDLIRKKVKYFVVCSYEFSAFIFPKSKLKETDNTFLKWKKKLVFKKIELKKQSKKWYQLLQFKVNEFFFFFYNHNILNSFFVS